MNIFWSLSTFLFSTGDVAASTFINFYIWESTGNDFLILLRYNIFLFAFIPIGALAFGYLAKKSSIKLSYSLGILLYCIQILLIILKGTNILNILLLFGFISGIAAGAHRMSLDAINQSLTNTENRDKYYGTQNALSNIVKLFIPPFMAFVIAKTGLYNNIFVPVFWVFIISSILGLLTVTQKEDKTYRLSEVFSFPGSNPDKSLIFNSLLVDGIRSSLMLVVFPIITLTFVGGLKNWGIFTFALTFFSIFASFIYGKLTSIKNSRYAFSFVGLVFSIVTLFFAIHFDLISLIAFSIAYTLLEIILLVSFKSDINTLTEQDNQISNLITEYNVFSKIPLNMGRLIPLMALYFLDISLKDDLILRGSFLVLGILPIIMLSIIGKSPEVSEETV